MSLALVSSLRITLAAMPLTSATFSNIQLAGYPAKRVFLPRVARAGENFAAGKTASPGRSGPIFAGLASAGDQAGGLQGLPASIIGNQSLSAALGATVATAASQRAAGSAEFRRLCKCRRMIANLRTRPSCTAIGGAGRPLSRSIAPGGATPSDDARASNIPFRTPCRDLRKSARSRLPFPDRKGGAVPPGPGSRVGPGPETPHCKLGSGVRVYPTGENSAPESAEFCGLRDYQRQAMAVMERVAGSHGSLNLRGNGYHATGRG